MAHKRDVAAILKHFGQLQGERTLFDALRERVAEVIWPDANDFFSNRVPGEYRSKEIFDASGATLLEAFAALEESMLTPRAQRWHDLQPSDENLRKDPEVKAFFQRAVKKLFEIRAAPKAKFYDQKYVGYKSLGAFGDECLFVHEVPGGTKYVNCHVSQVYVAEDQFRNIDTIYRKFPMTAKAAEQMWRENPNADLPPKVEQHLKGNPFQVLNFLHCVMPNPEHDPESLNARDLPWTSLYIGMEDKSLIEDSGYHENPYMYSRYTVNPYETYGRSPAMLVLPALGMLQEMAKTYVRAGHKANDPPLLAHDDGGTGAHQDYFLMPGGINFGTMTAQGRPLLQALQTGADVRGMENMIDRVRKEAEQAFISDVALRKALQDNPSMTATQSLQLEQVEGRTTAPTIGRQQAEMLGPMIEREVGICMRQNLFGELPEILIEARGQYEIEYVSESTRQQKAADVIAIDRALERMVGIAQIDPSVVDAFNLTEAMKKTARMGGVPEEVLATDEQIQAKQEARAKQQQQAEAMELLERGAGAAKDAASAVSGG